MDFQAATIWQDFKTASRTEQGTIDDNANEVILGPRLNHAVKDLANGYLKRLDLGPENKATDERAKLLDLHWGRIEHDGAQLCGLGKALTNFAETLRVNVDTLAERWKGESYDAFRAAMGKVVGTLSEYGAAATTTGEGLVDAMAQVREMYQTFADDTADEHLNFGDVSPPEKWHKVGEDGYTPGVLAATCPSDHNGGLVVDMPDVMDNSFCIKNNDEQSSMINGRWVTERRWEICKQDGCEESLDRVSIMYTNLVDQCQEAIDRIKGKLDSYFGAVQTTVDGVTQLYDAALGNVFNLANAEVFTTLRVIGGQPAGGDGADPVGAYPTGGGPSGAPVDSGYPGGGAPVDTGLPDAGVRVDSGAEPEPAAATAPEPAPADTTAQEQPVTDERETVRIKHGDHTIGVTSMDGEGRVRVTVADDTGATKTYELDFDAASGVSSNPPSPPEPGPDGVVPEQIQARTDGKCIIQDGSLTVTAERSLFSPDSIELVVDDGSGKPTTYTVDVQEQEPADAPQGTGQPTPVAGAAPPPTGTPLSGPGTTDPTMTDPTPADGAAAGAMPAAAMPAGPTGADVAVPAGSAVAGAASAGGDSVVPGGVPAGSAAGPASAGADVAVPGAPQAGPAAAPAPPVGDPTAASGPTAQPTPSGAVPSAQLTTPQAWYGDQAGSVSGVLVPDRPDDGEAHIAKAPDAASPEVAGMAGSALPITGGPSGGADSGGRAGSGWSVHGDLFGNTEPVYSVHGVLGDDERAAE